MIDWRTAPKSEKYDLYLNSREWAVKRNAVKARSGGICEVCHSRKGVDVHHLTYKRKYRERLDDLQHVCRECHEYTHGHTDKKPIIRTNLLVPDLDITYQIPATIQGKTIKSVYLAGKVSHGGEWRDELIPCDCGRDCDGRYSWSGTRGYWKEPTQDWAKDDSQFWHNCERTITTTWGTQLVYTGPYWLQDLDGSNGHGRINDYIEPHASESVFNNAMKAIAKSDLVFFWLDSADCYGSIAEIGYAHGLGKLIVIAVDTKFNIDDHWFVLKMASRSYFADSAYEAWNTLWGSPESKQTIPFSRPEFWGNQEIEWLNYECDENERRFDASMDEVEQQVEFNRILEWEALNDPESFSFSI